MWLLTFLLLIQLPNHATGECSPSISVPSRSLSVLDGQSFSLTCYFTCLTAAHRVQLVKGNQELTELSLSSACPASRHNVTLFVQVTAANPGDSGVYQCKSKNSFSPYITVTVTAHRGQLSESRRVSSEMSLSSTCPESKHNLTLYLNLPETKQNNSGGDQGDLLDTASRSPHTVNETDDCCPLNVITSEVKATCCNPPWSLLNAPIWYLLCKAAVFLICSLRELLKTTRQVS